MQPTLGCCFANAVMCMCSHCLHDNDSHVQHMQTNLHDMGYMSMQPTLHISPRPHDVPLGLWLDWTAPGGTAHWTALDYFLSIPPTQKFTALAKQICWCFGNRLDAILLEVLEDEHPRPDGLVQVRDSSSCFTSCHDVAVEGRLMRHVRACREACKGQLHFSFSSDSSRVGHLGLMNGVMVLPSNTAFCMAPQASSMFIGLVAQSGCLSGWLVVSEIWLAVFSAVIFVILGGQASLTKSFSHRGRGGCLSVISQRFWDDYV